MSGKISTSIPDWVIKSNKFQFSRHYDEMYDIPEKEIRKAYYEGGVDIQTYQKHKSAKEVQASTTCRSDDDTQLDTEETANLLKKHLRLRSFVFTLIFISNAILNYDVGALPAALIPIQNEFKIGLDGQGWLGALIYLGLSLGSPVCGYLLQRYSAKKLLIYGLLFNALACGLLVVGQHRTFLYASRFFVGMTQAMLIVYIPVWVDDFAPQKKRTSWISFLTGAGPIGMMLGYLVTSICINNGLAWRIPFLLQPFIIFFAALSAILLPPSLFNDADHFYAIQTSADRQFIRHRMRFDSFSFDSSDKRALVAQFIVLSRRPVYLFTTLSLAALYFVASGLQFWLPSYFIQDLKVDPAVVTVLYCLIIVTGPTLGTFLGGAAVDLAGGYRNITRATSVCMVFAVIAFTCAVLISFIENITIVCFLIWGLLCFGAALLPPCAGIVVSTVPKDMRPFSTALCLLTYNILGFFLAPLLTGWVSEKFGLKWGVRLVFNWSIFSIIFLGLAIYYSRKKLKPNTHPKKEKRRGYSVSSTESHERDRFNSMVSVDGNGFDRHQRISELQMVGEEDSDAEDTPDWKEITRAFDAVGVKMDPAEERDHSKFKKKDPNAPIFIPGIPSEVDGLTDLNQASPRESNPGHTRDRSLSF